MPDLLFPQGPIQVGHCQCGCGQKTAIAKDSCQGRGRVKGQPVRYMQGHNIAAPLRVRLLRGLVIDRTGCLLWTGKRDRGGYGVISVDGRDDLVHRVMYRMFVDEIPDGLQLDHVKAWGCTNRHCAAPAHLEPVTSLENNLRAGGIITAHAAATHCGTCGTPYDEENTYWSPDGHRDCRKCRRDRDRRYREQRKERAA